MNIQSILQSISGKLNQDQQNNLIQSINKAQEAMNLARNPIETLAKNNVSVEFLDNLKAYINNPVYSWIFKLLKLDKDTALRGIETAKNYLINNNSVSKETNHQLSNNINVNSTSTDDLDKFKRGLKRLK